MLMAEMRNHLALTSPEGQKSLRHVPPPQLLQWPGLPEQPRRGGEGGGAGDGGALGGAGGGGGRRSGGGGLAPARLGLVQHTLYFSLLPLL